MGVLSTGITALNAFRSQLTTTSHNVANVNTEGYSRQVVGLATLPATFTPIGSIGNGVQITEIRRQFDQFLMDRVRAYTSSDEDYQIYLDRASRVDDIIADPDAGLSQALQSFFNSMQDVADDPTSTATRDVLISSGNVLTDRFQSVFDFLEGMRSEINQDMQVLVTEANALASSVADLNQQIQLYTNSSGGNQPNDLLDQRDRVITQLSELVNITTADQGDGTVNVFIGNGQGLIIGARAFNMGTTINQAEPDRLDITLESGGGSQAEITAFLNGGKFGGYLRFRQNVLDPSQNAIGRLAMGLGTFVNEQHRLGMDLNGALGLDMFDIPDPLDSTDAYGDQMLLTSITTPIRIKEINVAEISTADYEITYQGANQWSILNRETGITAPPQTRFDDPDTAAVNDWIIEVDGIKLDVEPKAAGGGFPAIGAPAVGDSYILRPTRLASRAFEMVITDAREIAAATPISVEKNVVASGSTAVVSNTGLVSPLVASPDFTDFPVTLEYTTAGNALSVTAGTATIAPPTYTSGTTYTLNMPNLGDFEFRLSGVLSDLDSFDFDYNPTGTGNNNNALKLAELQIDKTMRNDTSGNPTSSFIGLYSSLIGEVGANTRQAIINSETQSKLKEQAETSLDAVAGVNLDEEAANLVHFQQAYQAATQVIRVSNQIFDSLINAVG